MADEVRRTCGLCGLSTEDNESNSLKYGDWMRKKTIEVHYFCLLFSTHLPQKGADSGGILGFLLNDIKREIVAAKNRRCASCEKPGASVCCSNCGDYFHVVCGSRCDCLFQFGGEFKAYCNECIPLTKRQIELQRNPPPFVSICHICKCMMGDYNVVKWFYADCCGNGPVHLSCMRKYAVAAGYYLKCIWCKNAGFREAVQKSGVFVPDRDALWEKSKSAYLDLHRGHQRCDVAECLCTRGREYTARSGPWFIVLCALCGSFGAHPRCIPGKEEMQRTETFKCDTCANIERQRMKNSGLNGTLYVTKAATTSTQSIEADLSVVPDDSLCNITSVRRISVHARSPQKPSILSPGNKSKKSDSIGVDIAVTQIGDVALLQSEEIPSPSEGLKELELHQFDGDYKCVGTIKVRINPGSPRFAGRNLDDEEILLSDGLITDADIVERSSDTGIFSEFENFMDEFIKANFS